MTTRRLTFGPSWSIPVTPIAGAGASASISVPRQAPTRIVPSAEQLVILNGLYARSGDGGASKEDVSEAARETGLEAKWVRKWIKRRQGQKSKGRKTCGSNTTPNSNNGSGPGGSSVSTSTRRSRRLSAANSSRPTTSAEVSQAAHHQLGSLTPSVAIWASPDSTSIKAEVSIASQPFASEHLSGPAVPGSGSGSGSPAGSNVAAQGWPRFVPTMSMPPLIAQPQDLSSYPIVAPHMVSPHATPSLSVMGLHIPPSSVEALTGQPDINNSLYHPSAHVPTTLSPSVLTVPPFSYSGLTSSAAYLYQIFNDSDNVAPVEAPEYNSAYYLTGLTRPSTPESNLQFPPSMATHIPSGMSGYPPAPFPVSYQMRLSDLISITKGVRDVTAADMACFDAAGYAGPCLFGGSSSETESTGCGQRSSDDEVDGLSFEYPDLSQALSDVAAGSADNNGLQLFEQEDACPAAVQDDGDTDTEQDEVVTPCEEIEFSLLLGDNKATHTDVAVTVVDEEAQED